MSPLRTATLVAVALICATTVASGKPATVHTLPLQRVRLYETGVGYFERSGKLQNGSGVSLPVPAGHLDDALKTLVILSADGSKVSGIEFRSTISRSLGRALAGLPAEDDSPLGIGVLLTSLKGARVELKLQGARHRGRLIDVLGPEQTRLESCSKGSENTEKPCIMRRRATVLLLTDRSEIRRFAVADLTSVRPLDPAARPRLDSALDSQARGGSHTRRALSVAAHGGQSITLGYVSETPVWRATYRLVLAPQDQAALQGWALIHNDTDEPWQSVRVELVNGQPDSFLFPLAAPRYAKRQLVTPDNPLSTVPQLLDRPADELWTTGDLWSSETSDAFGAGGLGLSGIGEAGGGPGEGIGLGSIGTIGHGAGSPGSAQSSSLLQIGSLADLAPAEGVEKGALFRYALAQTVDLRPHGSALVPFVQETVQARRIAWFPSAGATARSAVHLQNETSQTLPPGTIAVFADGGFAGESAIVRLKPKESRILRFGMDLDVQLQLRSAVHRDEPRLLRVASGKLTEHFVRKHVVHYELSNRSGSARTAYLPLEYVDNARVRGTDALAYDEAKRRAQGVFEIEPAQTRELILHVEEGLSESYPLPALSLGRVKKLAAASSLPAWQRRLLDASVTWLAKARRAEQRIHSTEAQLKRVSARMVELRDTLRVLPRTQSKAGAPLVRRLLATEQLQSSLTRKLEALKQAKRRLLLRARRELGRLNHKPKLSQSSTSKTRQS